jgi:predicted HicB family RNase H-like nuclease
MARTVTTKSGRVLTDDDIDKIADWFESGTVDISTWERRPGRPRLDPATPEHAPRIAVRVPGSLHRRVTAKAARERRSVSQVVRSLLEDYVASRESQG